MPYKHTLIHTLFLYVVSLWRFVGHHTSGTVAPDALCNMEQQNGGDWGASFCSATHTFAHIKYCTHEPTRTRIPRPSLRALLPPVSACLSGKVTGTQLSRSI